MRYFLNGRFYGDFVNHLVKDDKTEEHCLKVTSIRSRCHGCGQLLLRRYPIAETMMIFHAIPVNCLFCGQLHSATPLSGRRMSLRMHIMNVEWPWGSASHRSRGHGQVPRSDLHMEKDPYPHWIVNSSGFGRVVMEILKVQEALEDILLQWQSLDCAGPPIVPCEDTHKAVIQLYAEW